MNFRRQVRPLASITGISFLKLFSYFIPKRVCSIDEVLFKMIAASDKVEKYMVKLLRRDYFPLSYYFSRLGWLLKKKSHLFLGCRPSMSEPLCCFQFYKTIMTCPNFNGILFYFVTRTVEILVLNFSLLSHCLADHSIDCSRK